LQEIHEDNLVDDPDEIEKLFVNFSEGIFNNRNNLYRQCIIDDYIPNIVDNIMNAMLINQAIFYMNREGAPILNGLGALFFEKYGDIVRTNVLNAVSHLFKIDRLLPNNNSNNVVLITKSLQPTNMEH